MIQRQRPQGSSIASEMSALQEKLSQQVNVLDFVGSARPPPRSTSSSAPNIAAYKDSLSYGLSNELHSIDAQNQRQILESVHLRLGPMLGRTMPVDPIGGRDLQATFRALEMRCTINSVKTDARVQRFHARRGQAKKELRSKRWRALFKEGYLKEVGRMRRMKGQGW
jgi:Ribosomal protein S21